MTHEEMVQLAQETTRKLYDAAKENGFKFICAMHVGDKSEVGEAIRTINEVTAIEVKNFLYGSFEQLVS